MSDPRNPVIRAGLASGNPLAQGYLEGRSQLATFFSGDFRDPEAFRRKAREVDLRLGERGRKECLSFLLPPSPTAAAKLRRFVEDGGLFVTTGQQPGLLGGPLYTLYKALSAVGLAMRLEDLLGRPVLPLFWVASEDHDWSEVDHTFLLDRNNELVRFQLPAPGPLLGRPLHRIPLPREASEILDRFLQALPPSEHLDRYAPLLRDSLAPGRTLPRGFHTLLGGVMASWPLLFVDAAEPSLKRASLPLLLAELRQAESHEEALLTTSGALQALGYPLQVPILEGGVNLFLEGPQGRERLYRQGSGFRLGKSGLPVSLGEVVALAESDPSVLSPNVLLRPIVETALLPTVAYVAGPGEVAYFAQLGGLFEAHGVAMPVIVPRLSAFLVEGKVGKVLEKFHLEPHDLSRPAHELTASWSQEETPPDLRSSLEALQDGLVRGAEDLTRLVRDVDPTLVGAVTSTRNSALAALGQLEKKIHQAVRRRNRTLLEQLSKAQGHLFPLGRPQERVLNPFYYLARYGPPLLEALLEAYPIDLLSSSS